MPHLNQRLMYRQERLFILARYLYFIVPVWNNLEIRRPKFYYEVVYSSNWCKILKAKSKIKISEKNTQVKKITHQGQVLSCFAWLGLVSVESLLVLNNPCNLGDK